MLVAVVHAGGEKAARAVVARLLPIEGEPGALGGGFDCVIAGWAGSAQLSIVGVLAVEGIAGSTGANATPETAPEATETAYCARFEATRDGLVVSPGRGGSHRPVFVARRDGWTAASTRLKPLLRLLGERAPLDVDYLASCLLAEAPFDPTATPYTSVRRVPSCEAWLLRPTGQEVRSLEVLDPLREENRASELELARCLREAIASSVERSTRGATAVGVMLSGGVDSSSVLVTLESLRRSGRIRASVEPFSWEFSTPDPNDDRPYRRAVERLVGRSAHPVAPDEAGAFVRRAMVLDAGPCVDIPAALWLALDAAARKRGIDCILTGVGGDNVLNGHPNLLGDLALKGRPLEALRIAVGLRGVSDVSRGWKVRNFVLRPVIRRVVPERLRRAYARARQSRQVDWMAQRFDGWFDRREAARPSTDVALDGSPTERYMALARMPSLSWTTLLRSQQEEITRCRRVDPLFDDEVLRFVATVPPLKLLAGGFLRGLLRTAMVGLLPEEVRTRSWKAYTEPALVGMVSAAGGFRAFEDLARASRLADLGLVDPRRFRVHFDRLARQPIAPVWWNVWPVLAVEEFLRQHDMGQTS